MLKQGLIWLLLIGIAVGAWTFEKVTESGSTVGEIRSRVLSGVGTPSYSAFAYGPGSSAINGDIWYVPKGIMATQMDEGSLIITPLYMKLVMLLG